MHTLWQWILRKISKFDAARRQTKSEVHQIRFPLGLSAPLGPLTVFRGPTSKGGSGKGKRGGKGRRRGREGKGGESKGRGEE